MAESISIRASHVLLPSGDGFTVAKDKTVRISGNKIASIDDGGSEADGTVIDGRDMMLVPGFINGHIHAGAATYVRGIAEDRDLLPGTAFYHYATPLMTLGYKHFTPEEFAAVLEWDLLELVRKGSTTVLEENFGGVEAVAEIVERLGLRAYISASYPGAVANIGYIEDGVLKYDRPDPAMVRAGFERGLRLHDELHGSADDRIRVRLSPTGPDTCPPDILRETREAADDLGCGISVHASHHETEIQFCRDEFGVSPIEHLANTGILGEDAVVTHVTFTDERDRDLLAESGSTVVHCAIRKALEGIISPYYEYVERGINTALGTDAYTSDLATNIGMAARLGKIRLGRVGAPTATDVMHSATVAGAKGLGRDDLGVIREGATADLVLIDMSGSHVFPALDPVSQFVYYGSGADVDTVVVDGRIIVRNGVPQTTDEDELREKVRAAVTRIWDMGRDRGAI